MDVLLKEIKNRNIMLHNLKKGYCDKYFRTFPGKVNFKIQVLSRTAANRGSITRQIWWPKCSCHSFKKTEANEIDAKLKQKSSSRTHTLHYRALITNIYKLQTVINLCSQDMNRFNVFTYS